MKQLRINDKVKVILEAFGISILIVFLSFLIATLIFAERFERGREESIDFTIYDNLSYDKSDVVAIQHLLGKDSSDRELYRNFPVTVLEWQQASENRFEGAMNQIEFQAKTIKYIKDDQNQTNLTMINLLEEMHRDDLARVKKMSNELNIENIRSERNQLAIIITFILYRIFV